MRNPKPAATQFGSEPRAGPLLGRAVRPLPIWASESRHVPAVDRVDALDAADGVGEEDLVGGEQVVEEERFLEHASSSCACQL